MFFLYTTNILNIPICILYLFLICCQSFNVSSYRYDILDDKQKKNSNKIETLCFSCFSVYSSKPNYAIKNQSKTIPQFSKDYYNVVNVINKTGLIIPNYIYTCADGSPLQGSFQLLRANVRVCRNGIKNKGICVKWKGNYKDKQFVYRECWDRMWIKPRPFTSTYIGYCVKSTFKNNFNTSITNNILCFCEKDLCNIENRIKCLSLFFWLFLILYLIENY